MTRCVRNYLAAAFFVFVCTAGAYAQDLDQLTNATVDLSVLKGSLGGATSSFSVWDLMGGIIFGSVGFVAFIYGKKNALLKPMMIGLGLMAYPYFVRGTIAVYIIGVVLSAALYFFRD